MSSWINNGWVEDIGTGILFSAIAARLLVLPAKRAWARHRAVMADRHEELMIKHREHSERLDALEGTPRDVFQR
jgi:hypothetical protein